MKFNGHVQELGEHDLLLVMRPEGDSGPEELWRVERARVPEAWADVGAVCSLEVDAEDGFVRWMFDSSVILPADRANMGRAARSLSERFGLLFKPAMSRSP